MEEVIAKAEVVVVGTKGVGPEVLARLLRPEQSVVNLVRMEFREVTSGAVA